MKVTYNNILLTIAFIWLVLYSQQVLNNIQASRLNDDYKQEKEQFQTIIKEHEEQIFIDSVIISNMPISKRDSLRAIVNPR